MKTKPIETTYSEVDGKIEIKQVTINVCSQDDLKNVKGSWEKQMNGLKKQVEQGKALMDDLEKMTPDMKKHLESIYKEIMVERYPSKDKIEVMEKQIENLQKEVDGINKFIK